MKVIDLLQTIEPEVIVSLETENEDLYCDTAEDLLKVRVDYHKRGVKRIYCQRVWNNTRNCICIIME